MNDIETCYMCSKVATSREHVPPRCFFPERKDLPEGVDYRKNLMTVPSCNEHNSKSSKDDEYLLVTITAHYQNNQAGYNHYIKKIIRTFKHSTGLRRRFFEESLPVHVRQEATAVIFLETERILNMLDKIARGLHYKHFGEKWLTSHLWIFTPSRLRAPNDYDDLSLKICNEAKRQLIRVPCYGDNPAIFSFQPYQNDMLTMLKMTFYEGFEVYVLDAPQL
jgi:hypothetical protein